MKRDTSLLSLIISVSIVLSILLLFFGASAYGQESGDVKSVFSDKYDWYGIAFSVPDGYTARKIDVAWKVNKDFSHSYGQLFDVAATSGDGRCIVLYAKNLGRLVKKGIEEDTEGQMGRIYREILQAKGLLDEDLRFRRNRPSDFLPGRFITRISGEAVRDGFGADVMCMYTLETSCTDFKNLGDNGFKVSSSEYPCLVRLFLLKEGGANYDVLLLLSKEAQNEKERYIGGLLGNITFDQEKILKTWEVINSAD